jgi:hypothetical protein
MSKAAALKTVRRDWRENVRLWLGCLQGGLSKQKARQSGPVPVECLSAFLRCAASPIAPKLRDSSAHVPGSGTEETSTVSGVMVAVTSHALTNVSPVMYAARLLGFSPAETSIPRIEKRLTPRKRMQ